MIDFVLNHFDELATLPGAVPKLRSFILDQAVRGNLTADWRQAHPDVEPASALLDRIREEKKELVKAGKTKKQKELPPVEPDEVPFEVPKTWEWVRLGDVLHSLRIGPFGSLLHKRDYVEDGIPVVNPQHYLAGSIENRPSSTIPASKARELSVYELRSGDVVTARRGELGRNAVVSARQTGWICGTGSMVLRPGPDLSSVFVSRLLDSTAIREGLLARSRGATMHNLSATMLSLLPIPFAAIGEQTEIVRRVDDLMTVCDRLEAAQSRSEELRRNALASGAIHLTDDTSEAPFTKRWQRFSDRLPELVHHPADTKPVQDAVLQLAVRGHLTADWRAENPDVEPASVLLERIRAEKKELEKAGKIKKQKESPPVGPDEIPFEVPESWEWVGLGQVTSKIGSGSTPRGGKSVYVAHGVPFIRSQNVWNDGLRLEDAAHIPEAVHESMHGTLVHQLDVLYNITGASIGRASLVPLNLVRANVSQHVSIVRPIRTEMAIFLHLALIAPYFFGQTMDQQVGMSREGLSNQKLFSAPVPAPPIAEQVEIVHRMQNATGLLDQLRQAAEAVERRTNRLLKCISF